MAKPQAQPGVTDLFGNSVVSPRQLMQQQLAALLQETAARTASSDPRTQGVSLMGAGVGGILGQLLMEKGVLPKPPEIERAEKMEKARTAIQEDATKQGIDPAKDPSAFADLAVSHFMRAGDEQSAGTVLQWKALKESQARQVEKEKQDIMTKRSQEMKNLDDYTPASRQKFRETNDASHLVLTPEAMKKGRGEYFVPVSTEAGMMAFDARTGRIHDPKTGQLYTGPVVKDTADPSLQRKLSAGREQGKKEGAIRFDLPAIEERVNRAVSLIDQTIADPSLKNVTGPVMGRMPALFGGQIRAVERIDQLKGGVFLEAYQLLKGAGQITEIEGTKGEQAIARLSRAKTYEDMVSALRDLRDVVVGGLERARKQAGNQPAAGAPATPAPKRSREDILKQYGVR